jgi:hypothetical protein
MVSPLIYAEGRWMPSNSRRIPGLLLRGSVWHIDKVLYGKRICESTGTRDLTEAQALLAHRVTQARRVHLYGEQREHTFKEAVDKFLAENGHKRSLERDRRALAMLDSFIGILPLRRVHHDTLTPTFDPGSPTAAALRWQWEFQIPELGTSIFVIPRDFVKNELDRYVVLNRIARSVVDECRGRHSEFVFSHKGNPLTRIYNSGWKGARRRASARYEKEFGRPCPAGFRSIRVHDLKHTWGHRLRVAGVSFEDRKLLLGHKAQHVTTHYSAPEIGVLI